VNTGHGGAAAPSHHNLVGLTCRSAQTLANQRSTVRSSGTHRTCERALPPHLRLRLWASARQAGPLPWGEGVHHRLPSFQARPINIRKHPQAFPSPRGEGQGEGKRSLRILQPPRNCPTPCGARLSGRATAGQTVISKDQEPPPMCPPHGRAGSTDPRWVDRAERWFLPLPERPTSDHCSLVAIMPARLKITNVHKAFGATKALRGVSFAVAQVGNLPCRRMAFGRASAISERRRPSTARSLPNCDTAECHSALQNVVRSHDPCLSWSAQLLITVH
jgi:hypothetical protein